MSNREKNILGVVLVVFTLALIVDTYAAVTFVLHVVCRR